MALNAGGMLNRLLGGMKLGYLGKPLHKLGYLGKPLRGPPASRTGGNLSPGLGFLPLLLLVDDWLYENPSSYSP